MLGGIWRGIWFTRTGGWTGWEGWKLALEGSNKRGIGQRGTYSVSEANPATGEAEGHADDEPDTKNDEHGREGNSAT